MVLLSGEKKELHIMLLTIWTVWDRITAEEAEFILLCQRLIHFLFHTFSYKAFEEKVVNALNRFSERDTFSWIVFNIEIHNNQTCENYERLVPQQILFIDTTNSILHNFKHQIQTQICTFKSSHIICKNFIWIHIYSISSSNSRLIYKYVIHVNPDQWIKWMVIQYLPF